MSLNLLAIEASTQSCSIALCLGSNHPILQQVGVSVPQQHSAFILPMIENILLEAGISKAQLNVVALGRGPGRFSGVRLAISIAQAIAFAIDVPVIPVSSLRALAQKSWRQHGYSQVLAALDARLGQLYWGYYSLNTQTKTMNDCLEEKVSFPREISWPKHLSGGWRGISHGWDHDQFTLPGEWTQADYPEAYDVAVLAAQDYSQGLNIMRADEVKPLYLRHPIADAKDSSTR